MKSIILARVSTDDQKTEPQTARMLEYRDHNDRLDKWLEFEFDESSTKDQRVKFEAVIEEIRKSKEIVALIVETIDRLQRSFKESVLLDDFRKQGKLEIHFIREGLVLNKESNSSDLLRWDMGVMFARSYVLQLSDNVKRTREKQLNNGQWPHRAPIGYKNIDLPDGSKDIVPDTKRAQLIVGAFETYASGGKSLEMILKDLNSKGLTSPLSDCALVLSHLATILKNPFYYGWMVVKGEKYQHKYQPIISKDLFDKCQDIRLGRSKTKYRYAGKPFAYRGLIKCDHCGCSISSDTKVKKSGKQYTYLFCTQYKGKCGAIRLRDKIVDDQVIEAFKSFQLPRDVIERVNYKLNLVVENERKYYKQSSDDIIKQIMEIDRRIDLMYQDRLARRITPENYDKFVIKEKEKQEDLNAQLKDHIKADKSFLINVSSVMELSNHIVELYQSSEVEEKRQIINFTLSNLRLKGEKLVFNLKTPFNLMALCAKTSDWQGQEDSNP